jgi:hypothetical protein
MRTGKGFFGCALTVCLFWQRQEWPVVDVPPGATSFDKTTSVPAPFNAFSFYLTGVIRVFRPAEPVSIGSLDGLWDQQPSWRDPPNGPYLLFMI